jgi:hypothetical protein
VFRFFAPRPGFAPFIEVVDYEDLIGVKAYKRAFLKTESGKRISIEASPLWNGERSPKKQDRQLRHQKESSSEERCSIYTSIRVRHLLVVVPISYFKVE